jgi:hypothetical protein
MLIVYYVGSGKGTGIFEKISKVEESV